MSDKKLTLKDFISREDLHKKTHKGQTGSNTTKKYRSKGGGLADSWFTTGGSGDGGAGAVGEGLITELLAGITPSSFSANINSASAYSKNSNNKDAGMTTYPSAGDKEYSEEEPEMKANKVDQARQLFQAMYNQPNATRAEIINAFMKDVGVTNSTAVSYYTRFLDEFGLSSKDSDEALGQGVNMGGGMGQPQSQQAGQEVMPAPAEKPPEMEEPVDPDRAGIIRTVKNAHLVYKRQEEDGTYEELWIYNIHDSTNDEMDIRRDILAGTDIPAHKTKSLDGQQSYSAITMGNAQMLKVTGLPN